MVSRPEINMALGDPGRPYTWLATHAFRAAQREAANQYQMFNATRRQRDPIVEASYPLVHYLRERGFVDGLRTPYSFLPTSGGTTRAYDLVIEKLADEVRGWNASYKHKIKPVMIMPVPTYGFFFDPVKNRNIEIVHVARDLNNGGWLDPALLDQTIKDVNAQGKRVIGYYDSNPHNPLGLVRGEEETRAIAAVLDAHSDAYEEADKRLIRGYGREAAYARGWTGPIRRICKIDDMVYDGLQYGETQPFSFAQIKGAERDTFVLFGTSKVGFVTARAGLIVGPESAIQKMARANIYTDYFPPPLVIHALAGHMNLGKEFIQAREKHLGQMNREHALAGKFMKILINGADKTPEITGHEVDHMFRAMGQHTCLRGEVRKAWLKQGIPGVNVITSPQAGFFHLLDFGSLKEQVAKSKNNYECGESHLNDAFSRASDIKFATGGYMGLDPEDLIMRATYAVSPNAIINFARRVKNFMRKVPFQDRSQPVYPY